MGLLMRLGLIFLILIWGSPSWASDQTAASCSAAHIQTAINSCISTGGGTVTIPVCESLETWGATDKIVVVTDIPYKIVGAGKTSTKIGYSSATEPSGYMWSFRGNGLQEFANMYLEGSSNTTHVIEGASPRRKHAHIKIYSISPDTVTMPDAPTNAKIHGIETKYFTSRGTICHTKNLLVYDNVFNQVMDGNEYHFDIYDKPTYQWSGDGVSFPTDWGTNKFNVFFEDNVFYGAHHFVSNFNMAKVVFRYNTCIVNPDQVRGDNNGSNDVHEPGYSSCGDDGISDANTYYHGGKAYEIYNNTYTRTGSLILDGAVAIRMRSGYSIITNNSISNYSNGINLVVDNHSVGGLCNSANSFQRDYNILKDTGSCGVSNYCCEAPSNSYSWNNTTTNVNTPFKADCGGTVPSPCSDAIKENVHYFQRAPTLINDGFVWIPYTYPHPLRGSIRTLFRL